MTDFRLSFDPMFSWWIILAIVLISFVFFLRLELKRKQALLIPRILALVLVSISILALLLRPYFKVQKSEAILLTPGFDKSKVDSLLKQEPQLKIFGGHQAESYPHSEALTSLQNLSDKNIKYIFGEGLHSYAFDLMPRKHFRFFPCQLPFGVIELRVPKIFSSRKNSISGLFHSAGKTKLKLIGPSGTEDSVYLNKGKNKFTLSLRPKQSGLFIYDLVSQDSLGNKSLEKLPIEVVSENALRVLFIQKFPSAEVRSLKNFLSDKGHLIVVRLQTSMNNFNEEFVNIPKIRLNQFTGELLNSFDLVLMDSKMIEALSVNEKSTLQKSVFNGLGLIVIQNDVPTKPDFYLVKGEKISNDTVHLHLQSKEYILPAMPIKVSARPSIETLIKTKDRILTGYQFLGSGKIAFQFLQETYRLTLEGKNDDYAFIWSSLIEKVARKKNQKFELKLSSPFPYYPNEPIDLFVISSGQTPSIYSDGIKVSVNEDALLDDYWKAKSWAGKSGWHKFSAIDSTELNYFINDPLQWKSLRIANQVKETSLIQNLSPGENQIPPLENERVSNLLFYMVFILAIGFLWLAPKI